MGFDLTGKCHEVELLQDNEEHGESIMREYFHFFVKPHSLFDKLAKWHPSLDYEQV